MYIKKIEFDKIVQTNVVFIVLHDDEYFHVLGDGTSYYYEGAKLVKKLDKR